MRMFFRPPAPERIVEEHAVLRLLEPITIARMTLSPTMRYVTSRDGTRIAYITVGEGPPLVFASSIFGEATGYCKAAPFSEVAQRLAGLGWRVVLYDQRGMANSDRDVEDLSLDARVDDLRAVVAAVNLNRFALVGVDVGAATAIAFTANFMASVSRLALLSPWASGARYLAIPALRAAYAAEAPDGRDRELFADILGSVASGFADPEYVREGSKLFLETVSSDVLIAFNAASARIDVSDLLPRIMVPTLVTYERPFPFGSFELCQEVASGIPDAEFLVLNANSLGGRNHDENVLALDRFFRGWPLATNGTAPPLGLTSRQVEVLRHLAAGASNKDIAAKLGVAVSTVERHLVNLYTKIGARGRADAIAFAFRRGFDRPR